MGDLKRHSVRPMAGRYSRVRNLVCKAHARKMRACARKTHGRVAARMPAGINYARGARRRINDAVTIALPGLIIRGLSGWWLSADT